MKLNDVVAVAEFTDGYECLNKQATGEYLISLIGVTDKGAQVLKDAQIPVHPFPYHPGDWPLSGESLVGYLSRFTPEAIQTALNTIPGYHVEVVHDDVPPPQQEEIVRVLRVVEYTGPRELVEKQVGLSVHGSRNGLLGRGKFKEPVRITAVTLSEFPEVLEKARQDYKPISVGTDRNLSHGQQPPAVPESDR